MNRLFLVPFIIIFWVLLSILFTPQEPITEPKKERNFRSSKILAEEMYFKNRVTFYCGCNYDENKKIDLESCGYIVRKNLHRASRMEWEHIVPASYYGRSLSCWQEGGRNNCTSHSNTFSNFEGDLHNLVPAIGEINGDRSDKIHGETSGESLYGKCDFVINGKIAQPRKEVRGDVARIWLYMSHKYNIFLTREMKEVFYKWSKADPVDEYEKWRNKEIKRIQGDGNIYIK